MYKYIASILFYVTIIWWIKLKVLPLHSFRNLKQNDKT